jgi:DNA polymerase/3'-5' exonuclease PolX
MALDTVPGIGPKKADILKKSGIRDISDLYNIKYFPKLSSESKSFLIYKPEKTVPRKFINKVDAYFKLHNIKGIITGSYRRGKPVSKDIDFLSYISQTKLIKLIESLDTVQLFIHSRGSDKIGAVLEIFQIRVRIDIWFPKRDERLYYLFYTTGNATFNIVMRKKAKDKGYKLNRHGLFKQRNTSTGITYLRVKNINTEKALMSFIGKSYLKPEEREY